MVNRLSGRAWQTDAIESGWTASNTVASLAATLERPTVFGNAR
jgi:hypothetical protein